MSVRDDVLDLILDDQVGRTLALYRRVRSERRRKTMSYCTLTDNGGRVVPPHPHAANPVAASGATLTDAATGGDHTETVEAGQLYAFTCLAAVANSTFIFGIADVTEAANILWACPPGETVLISIPDDVTTLHYESLANGGTGYLRKLQ